MLRGSGDAVMEWELGLGGAARVDCDATDSATSHICSLFQPPFHLLSHIYTATTYSATYAATNDRVYFVIDSISSTPVILPNVQLHPLYSPGPSWSIP